MMLGPGDVKRDITDLTFGGSSVIVAVGGGAEGSARAVGTRADASPLCEVLLTLGLADLYLLLLAAAAELLRLEGILGLELSATVLGDVPVGHGGGRVVVIGDGRRRERRRRGGGAGRPIVFVLMTAAAAGAAAGTGAAR